jgi:hypothetical protein
VYLLISLRKYRIKAVLIYSRLNKYLASLLRFAGENRELVLSFMRVLIPSGNDTFVLMDLTHVMSAPEHPALNAKGYNGAGDFGKHIRVMYLFQAAFSRPVYYRLVKGNMTDISFWNRDAYPPYRKEPKRSISI